MEIKIFIYTLTDPTTNEVRYIGKTTNINNRLKKHITESKHQKTHKEKWINSLIINNLKPLIDIIDIVDERQWSFYETYWISQFRTWGFNLVNGTSGGEGSDGFKNKKHSDTTKEKISNTLKETSVFKTLKFCGENHGKCKLTDIQLYEIKEKIKNGEKIIKISKDYNITRNYVYMIKNGKRRK